MRISLGLTTIVSSFLITIQTQACSCMDFANAQQAAQTKNVVIAKVETISNSEGKARVRVEKVLKGTIENVYLDVQGQDGVNCNGENIQVGKKGFLIFQKTENGYQTLSCATTNIPQVAPNQYQIFLGEEFLLTEKELRDVLDFKLHASVKSAECQITVERIPVPFGTRPELSFRYDTAVSAAPTREDVTILKTTVDLSPQAPQVGELLFYAEVQKLDKANYEFNIRMKDPFTGTLINQWSKQLDVRKNLQFNGPSFNRFTDLNGNPMTDSSQPFLSHETRTFCALNLGQPLEVFK